ncbi:hypothetical protein EJ05DRAFT_337399 [Pseudovirgaria hyperparasitica]|uniref:PA14 domain-containing protein n=1 Tax=Pseudovirgaria hyperparasitica TaxID=470096 RepID=A0A6A6W8L0_9PEZI|nr:uncharacterized protein EJ05DRAFT_337399 [Pseudovirgaria hyperparasitica]KAF2759218.1 hypothetical protein EJ05DRAFT_337399 [Pseudovirgaria hyperparasitica]
MAPKTSHRLAETTKSAFRLLKPLCPRQQRMHSCVTGIVYKSSIVIPPFDPSCPSLPIFCPNAGWEWAYYNNSASNTAPGYPSFNPAALKTTVPIYTGTTRTIGLPIGSAEGGPAGPIYGSTVNLVKTQYAINHRAYLYACETGTYTIQLNDVDDALYTWIGPEATAFWNGTNREALVSYQFNPPGRGNVFFNVYLLAKRYYPIRFVFAGAQSGGRFTYSITAPSGRIVAGDQVENSAFTVRSSCDAQAPGFPFAFGQEL